MLNMTSYVFQIAYFKQYYLWQGGPGHSLLAHHLGGYNSSLRISLNTYHFGTNFASEVPPPLNQSFCPRSEKTYTCHLGFKTEEPKTKKKGKIKQVGNVLFIMWRQQCADWSWNPQLLIIPMVSEVWATLNNYVKVSDNSIAHQRKAQHCLQG